MKLLNALVAIAALSAGAAMAADKTPNCEVKNKKSHVKDEAACTKKGGKWLATDAAASTAAGAAGTTATPAEAAPAVEAAPHK